MFRNDNQVIFRRLIQSPMEITYRRTRMRQRPGVHAYHKRPVLLLPSGPDKIWAL